MSDAQLPNLTALRRSELRTAASPPLRWLLHGYIATSRVTLLTSQWKAGKTTWMTILADRMRAGGELGGREVIPGKAVIVSEEDADEWDERCRQFKLDDHVLWMCRPFEGVPTQEQWLQLIERVAFYRREFGADLAVFDPLAELLPSGSEFSSRNMEAALKPLRQLTDAGMAVLLLHHPRKQVSRSGHAARGTGALSAFVDILIEMDWYRLGQEGDRRRRLTAFARRKETPHQLIIELNAEGTGYLAHGDFAADEFEESWLLLHQVLQKAERKQSRDDVLKCWPKDEPRPAPTTLWRWLEGGVAAGRLRRDGQGTPGLPFRYWLPELEERWESDPLLQLIQQTQADGDLLNSLCGGRR